MQSTDLKPPADGAAAAAARQALFGGSRQGRQHKMQPDSMSGSEHCTWQSWTVLEQACLGELPSMTGSAPQTQQRVLGNL